MPDIISFVRHIQQHATAENHRQIVRLQGDLSWCYQQAEYLIKQLQLAYFWCGPCPDSLESVSYKQILGQETSLLFINALHDFDANEFAASVGCLRGGGLLILLTPIEIPADNLFYQYLHSQLTAYNFVTISKDHPLPQFSQNAPLINKQQPLNLSQQPLAIAAIIKTVSGHRRRPLVLTANRGRGKSAALGIAAAELLNSGLNTILVCAPNKQATSTLFKHANLLLVNEQQGSPFTILSAGKRIEFIAPDVLLAERPKCDLLIIDEAAALPVPTLEALATHYSRLVFATTQHGYEGSGRGFALRFQKRLNEISPQWRKIHLEQPIRWAANDPVESFSLQNLCLTEGSVDNPRYDSSNDIQFAELTAQQLIKDKPLLQNVFSLLVLAHYQTKPSDLQKLLNDRALHIFIMIQNQQILGVSLINKEGGFDKQMCEQIWQGKRRVQGNLVAQSLTFHSACKQAAALRYARIQRIAIHPALQHLGLGKRFVSYLCDWANNNKFDQICASFGATADLLSFWQQLSFSTLRIGLSKDSSSGTHSLIVSRALSLAGQILHSKIQQQFTEQLAIQLSRHLQQIEADLVLKLLQELSKTTVNSAQLDSYINGNLPYEFVEAPLIKLILTANLKNLSKMQQCLTIQKILQNHSWAEICKNHSLTGKKQAQSHLKSAIQQLLAQEEEHAPR